MGLKSEDACVTQLQAILRIAQDIREVAAVSLTPACSPPPTHGSPIDSIRLPSPHPLLPSLLEAGICPEIASAASQIYQRRAEQLKQRIHESVVTACRTAEEFPVYTSTLPINVLMKRVLSLFADVYVNRLKEWKEEIIQRVKQASQTPVKEVPCDSRTFNQEYVPLLEHFFQENPFPTRGDKMFLAKKSNMQYKQIHVWFQNRRNRTKKDVKPLGKKPAYEKPRKLLDKLYEPTKCHAVDSYSQVPDHSKLESTSEVEIARGNMSNGALASPSPPHAFPSTYPPTCNYDPFPCKRGFICFSKPEWRRAPDEKRPLPISTSIDDLVERFSSLNIRDDAYSKRFPRPPSHAATTAFTVIPSCAPHPALVTREYRQPKNVVQRHPLVRASVSSSDIFQNHSPTSKPVTLVPFVLSSELPGGRKTAPLLRRFPGRMRGICRDTTPPESSSTSSTSPRPSSLESGNHSYSSSISSLSTPQDIASPQELPHLLDSPCRSPFESPIRLCNFGDIASIMLPSVS